MTNLLRNGSRLSEKVGLAGGKISAANCCQPARFSISAQRIDLNKTSYRYNKLYYTDCLGFNNVNCRSVCTESTILKDEKSERH